MESHYLAGVAWRLLRKTPSGTMAIARGVLRLVMIGRDRSGARTGHDRRRLSGVTMSEYGAPKPRSAPPP